MTADAADALPQVIAVPASMPACHVIAVPACHVIAVPACHVIAVIVIRLEIAIGWFK